MAVPNKSQILTIQLALLGKGYDPGPRDGLWGTRTQSALENALEKVPYSGTASPKQAPQPPANVEKSSRGFILNRRSMKEMKHVHPDLKKVQIEAALTWTGPGTWMVIDGDRTIREQRRLVAKGFSKTMRSRHLIAVNGYAHATDFLPLDEHGKADWNDIDGFKRVGKHLEATAKRLGVAVKWGGRWKWKDWGHIQLKWRNYPGTL
jgi:hypothetical protein